LACGLAEGSLTVITRDRVPGQEPLFSVGEKTIVQRKMAFWISPDNLAWALQEAGRNLISVTCWWSRQMGCYTHKVEVDVTDYLVEALDSVSSRKPPDPVEYKSCGRC
jgi:hypothetical protein